MDILSLTDLTLIAQVSVDSSGRAFERLVRKYQSPVRRFFLNQTAGDTMLSDDLAQETFIKVYVNISSFRQLSSFKTWLFKVAYNVWQDYIRSNKPTLSLITESPAEGENKGTKSIDSVVYDSGSGAGTDSSEASLDLNSAMKILTENERTCVTLALIEDLPMEKVAAITGIPAGTVKSHIHRGKHKLAEYLKQNGYE